MPYLRRVKIITTASLLIFRFWCLKVQILVIQDMKHFSFGDGTGEIMAFFIVGYKS